MDERSWSLFQDMYVNSGWSRLLPDGAIEVMQIVTRHPGISLQDLHVELSASWQSLDGLESEAWEQLNTYTDEELARLDADFEGTPLASSEEERQQTAAEVMADEAELRAAHVSEMDRFSAHLGVRPVRTFRDLLKFITPAGVLRFGKGGYDLNPAAPLPEEALPLSDATKQREGELRWRRIHEKTAYAIIGVFGPNNAARIDRITTSLTQLSAEISKPIESVREAGAHLVSGPDFSSTHEILTLDPDETFTLTVDWAAFRANRISLRFGHSAPEGNA